MRTITDAVGSVGGVVPDREAVEKRFEPVPGMLLKDISIDIERDRMQLTGNLEDLGLGEIFQILNFSGKSGTLRLRSTKGEGLVVFRDGSVVKAASAAIKENVGDLLLKEGAITLEQLGSAKERQKKYGFAEPLGRILKRDCKVSPDLIENIARKHIEKAVHTLFFWQDGYFTFELGDYRETPAIVQADPLQHTLMKGMNPQFLAMEGLRLVDESKKDPANPAPPAKEEKEEASEGKIDTRRYAQELLKEIGDDGGFPSAGTEAPVVATSKGLKVLKEMLEELTRPLSLNEIVLLVLRFSSEMINRTVVFTVKNGRLVGFGQSGIELNEGIADNKVRKMSIPEEGPSILTDAINEKRIVVKDLVKTPWNDYIVEHLGGRRPVEAFAAPVMVQGKVAMILYGDNVPGANKLDDLSTLDIFLGQTGVAIERMLQKTDAGAHEGRTRQDGVQKHDKRAI